MFQPFLRTLSLLLAQSFLSDEDCKNRVSICTFMEKYHLQLLTALNARTPTIAANTVLMASPYAARTRSCNCGSRVFTKSRLSLTRLTISSASLPPPKYSWSRTRNTCWVIAEKAERPRAEPSDRNRYEQAVAIAWSSGAAFDISAIREVVTPKPLPKPLKMDGLVNAFLAISGVPTPEQGQHRSQSCCSPRFRQIGM